VAVASQDSPGRLPSRRIWALVLGAAVGLGLVLLVPIAPWYAETANLEHWTVENVTIDLNSTTTFYPGDNYRFLCYTHPLTAPVWGSLCTISQQETGGILQPYEEAHLPLLGHSPPMDLQNMYSTVYLLSAAGFSVGAFGLAMLLLGRRQQRGDWTPTLVSAVALLAAGAVGVGMVVGVAVLQPAAVLHDFGYSLSAGVGPWSTFWGSSSCSATACGAPQGATESSTWGPAIGWFLEVAGGSIFLCLGAVLLRRCLRLRRLPLATPKVEPSP
jgi:hypothetical protein